MKIQTINVSRSTGNTDGSFGSRTLGLVGELAEGDSLDNCIDVLQALVDYKLGLTSVNPVEAKTSKSSTDEGKTFENTAKEEKTSDEKAAEKKAIAAAKKKKATTTKKVKNTAVPYNRELNAHKDEFAAALLAIDENWKASKRGQKSAKETSLAVAGMDMFTSKEDKTIVASFMEALETEYKKHYEANKDV